MQVGSYLSFHDFNTFFNAKSNILQYSGLISAFRSYQKNDGRFIRKEYNLRYPNTVIIFMNSNKDCKEMYMHSSQKRKSSPHLKKMGRKRILLYKKRMESYI